VDVDTGKSLSWVGGHDGGLLCATGRVLSDHRLHRPDDRPADAEEPNYLFTGGGDWAICEWELK